MTGGKISIVLFQWPSLQVGSHGLCVCMFFSEEKERGRELSLLHNSGHPEWGRLFSFPQKQQGWYCKSWWPTLALNTDPQSADHCCLIHLIKYITLNNHWLLIVFHCQEGKTCTSLSWKLGLFLKGNWFSVGEKPDTVIKHSYNCWSEIKH